MNYLKQKEGIMDSEAQESSYRKRFPKGPDWEEPKPGPYNLEGQRIPTSAYHGMEVVAISIEKYNELKEKYEELEQKYYFGMRDKQIEIEVLKAQINKG